MKPQQFAELHKDYANAISAILGHDGIISIVAGNTRLNIFPGSEHYMQLKHKLSDFGCDHVAKKLLQLSKPKQAG
jgi:hypothetical protein